MTDRVLPPRVYGVGAIAAGLVRPALPVSLYANDFALIVRTPRRLRIARGTIRVLS